MYLTFLYLEYLLFIIWFSTIRRKRPTFHLVSILSGDFSAYNIVWWSTTTNTSGKEIEHFINVFEFILVNTGTSKYLTTLQVEPQPLIFPFVALTDTHLIEWKSPLTLYSSDYFPQLRYWLYAPYPIHLSSNTYSGASKTLTGSHFKKTSTSHRRTTFMILIK